MRGVGVADALTEWVVGALADIGGADAPTLLTILGGNRAMERRTAGRGGAARLHALRDDSRVLDSAAVASGGSERAPICAYLRRHGRTSTRWRRFGGAWRPGRQFAPVFDAERLGTWIASAPGLDIGDYRVAREPRRPNHRIHGVVGSSRRSSNRACCAIPRGSLWCARRSTASPVSRVACGFRASAGRCAIAPRCTSAFPRGDPTCFARSCVRAAPSLRAQRYAFATIGLDVRDPLCAAMAGLGAQPTDVNAYVVTPGGAYAGPPLGDRPLHYELSLV